MLLYEAVKKYPSNAGFLRAEALVFGLKPFYIAVKHGTVMGTVCPSDLACYERERGESLILITP